VAAAAPASLLTSCRRLPAAAWGTKVLVLADGLIHRVSELREQLAQQFELSQSDRKELHERLSEPGEVLVLVAMTGIMARRLSHG